MCHRPPPSRSTASDARPRACAVRLLRRGGLGGFSELARDYGAGRADGGANLRGHRRVRCLGWDRAEALRRVDRRGGCRARHSWHRDLERGPHARSVPEPRRAHARGVRGGACNARMKRTRATTDADRQIGRDWPITAGRLWRACWWKAAIPTKACTNPDCSVSGLPRGREQRPDDPTRFRAIDHQP